jgi:hypothetical protein
MLNQIIPGLPAVFSADACMQCGWKYFQVNSNYLQHQDPDPIDHSS